MYPSRRYRYWLAPRNVRFQGFSGRAELRHLSATTIPPESTLVSLLTCALTCALALFAGTPSSLHAQTVTFNGQQTTVASTGLSGPYGVAVDSAGDVFLLRTHLTTGYWKSHPPGRNPLSLLPVYINLAAWPLIAQEIFISRTPITIAS